MLMEQVVYVSGHDDGQRTAYFLTEDGDMVMVEEEWVAEGEEFGGWTDGHWQRKEQDNDNG